MIVFKDCMNFNGEQPCMPHKYNGVHCENCNDYDPIKERILIIKLGATGDVIRSTPLLRQLRKTYPKAEITWLTHTPEIIPALTDRRLQYENSSILSLLADSFDLLINLDKDQEAISLTKMMQAKQTSEVYKRAVSEFEH